MLRAAFVLAATITLALQNTSQATPTIPSWIRPGLTLTYSGTEKFSQANGGSFGSTRLVGLSTRVSGVSKNAVKAVSEETSVGGTISWQCNASTRCWLLHPARTQVPILSNSRFTVKFWVDPHAPTYSTDWPWSGNVVKIAQGTYSVARRKWQTTTVLYKDYFGATAQIVYETRTGLVLAYIVNSPMEQVNQYFESMK